MSSHEKTCYPKSLKFHMHLEATSIVPWPGSCTATWPKDNALCRSFCVLLQHHHHHHHHQQQQQQQQRRYYEYYHCNTTTALAAALQAGGCGNIHGT